MHAEVFAVTLSQDVYVREMKLYAGSMSRVYTGGRINELIPDITKAIKTTCGSEEKANTIISGKQAVVGLVTHPPFDLKAVHRKGIQIADKNLHPKNRKDSFITPGLYKY